MTTLRTATAAILSTLACAATFACVDVDSLEGEDFRSTRGGGGGQDVCPTYICGGNANRSASFSFNVEGALINDNKVVSSVTDPWGFPAHIVVNDSEFSIVRYAGNVELTGEMMLGTEIEFYSYESNNNAKLTLVDYDPEGVDSLLFPGVRYPTYEFEFTDENGVTSQLCTEGDWDEGNPIPASQAIVVQNEAYDWYGQPIANIDEMPGGSANWVSVGCLGGAFAKKALMGYDMNIDGPNATTREENHTMMNMLTARYCGGESYTFTGMPVTWQNDKEWYQPSNTEVEAMWTEDGAICLNEPRLVPRGQVLADCGFIPTCDEFNPNDFELVSYHAAG